MSKDYDISISHDKLAKEAWSNIDESEEELREYIPDFRYIVHDLAPYSDEEIRGSALLKVILLLFKHIKTKGIDEKIPEILNLIVSIKREERTLGIIEKLLHYLYGNLDKSYDEFIEIVNNSIPIGKEEAIMTLAESIKQIGRQEGRQEGRREEMQEGIMDVLQIRFSSVPDYFINKLKAISDLERLRSIRREAVKAGSVAELDFYLQ